MAKISSYDVRKLTIGENTYGALERDPDDPRFYNSILYKITLSRSGKIDFTASTDFDGLRYAVLDKDGDEIRNLELEKMTFISTLVRVHIICKYIQLRVIRKISHICIFRFKRNLLMQM